MKLLKELSSKEMKFGSNEEVAASSIWLDSSVEDVEKFESSSFMDMNKLKSAMYAEGQKVETDLKMWHKRIGHINLQKL